MVKLHIAKHIVPAILNDDYSGLNESECACAEAFCEKYYIYPPDDGEYGDIRRCAVTGFASYCYEVEATLIDDAFPTR